LNHTSNEDVTLSIEQQTVFNWLNDELELPVYAEAYKGALELLDKKPPGHITFVSHAGRDLMNGLARLGSGREQVQYTNRLDELQDDWEDESKAGGFNEIDDAENGHFILVPSEIWEKINRIIDEHRAGRLRPSEAAILFFSNFLDYAYPEEIPQNLLTEWLNTRDWFMGHAHLRDSAFEMDASTEVEKHFQTLDDLLYNAASSELDRIRSIDEILEETNE